MRQAIVQDWRGFGRPLGVDRVFAFAQGVYLLARRHTSGPKGPFFAVFERPKVYLEARRGQD
jgi:hypothetical protein